MLFEPMPRLHALSAAVFGPTSLPALTSAITFFAKPFDTLAARATARIETDGSRALSSR